MTRGVASGVVSATGNALGEVATAIFWGSFNPKYSKEDQRRMRYIQAKYCQAYADINSGSSNNNNNSSSSGAANDRNAVISAIDPNSRLKMSDDGVKSANPFPRFVGCSTCLCSMVITFFMFQ
jgi:hypothetical protein